MKNMKKALLMISILSIIVLSNQMTPSISSTTTSYSGIRTNRLIPDNSSLTFTQNDTFTVFMTIQNIKQEVVYNLNFNYTVNKDLFSINSSSNTTQSSDQWVYYNFGKMESGQTFDFNMTFTVVTNKTQAASLGVVTLKYEFGADVRLPGSTDVNDIKINIQAPKTSDTLPSKAVFGLTNIDNTMLLLIVALPIVVGFGLSFIFGRRRNKL